MAETRGAEEKNLKVFISYSRKDIAFAQRIVAALETRGLAPKIDTRDLPKLEDWRRELLGFIREADAVVFIVSPNSISSPVCSWEVEQVAKLNKRLAPIVLERVSDDRIPAAIAKINYLFFDQPDHFEHQTDELARALQTDLVWLKEHTRLGELARRWDERRRATGWLLRGQELQDAESWIASRPRSAPEPTELHREFIVQSRRGATRRQRLTLGGSLIAAVIGLGLAGLAYWQRGVAVEQERVAEQQRSIAEAQRQIALTNEKEATRQRDEALLTQSRYLSDAARQATEQEHDPGTGVLLALEALPDSKSNDDVAKSRPYWAPAEVSLERARRLLQEQAILAGHNSAVTSVAVSSDGTHIVSGSYDGTARVWDAKTYTEVGKFEGHAREVEPNAVVRLVGPPPAPLIRSVAVSPDGTRNVAGSDDAAWVWDAKTFLELATLKATDGSVHSVAVSPDGSRIVTGPDVWDAKTYAKLGELKGHVGSSVGFTRDGTRIVTDSWDNTAEVWDAKTLAKLGELKGHAKFVTSVAISPDGTRIVTGSWDNTARVWDARTFAELGLLKGHSSVVMGVAFTPDGKHIVTGSFDQTVRVWDAQTFAELSLLNLNSQVWTVAVNQDGTHIITGSSDNLIRVWDAKTSGALANFKDLVVYAVRPDWTRVVTSASDQTARVWEVKTSVELGVLEGHHGDVTAAAVSPDGRRIVTGSQDNTALVFDAQTFTKLGELKDHRGIVNQVAVCPDGKRIVTASTDNMARVFDAQTFAKLGELKGDDASDYKVAVSPDGSCVIVGSNDRDNTTRVWDAKTFEELGEFKELRAKDSHVENVAVSPDGAHIITGSADNLVRVWDAKTFVKLGDFNSGPVGSIAVTPDGRRILTGSSDRTVRVWDAKTFVELAVLREPIGSDVVAISPDGTRVITHSGVWELFPSGQALIDEAKALMPRCLTAEQRELYHLSPAPPSWCKSTHKWPYQ
jgi:WD40 repeat protein